MKRYGPLAMLLIAVAMVSALQVAYTTTGATASDAAAVLMSLVLGMAFIIWMVADARVRRQTPCYDFGFLVAVFFPVSLLWYVVWSRGWRGTLTLAALLGLMLLPWLSAAAAWIIRYGLP
jgi:hypothetical protein